VTLDTTESACNRRSKCFGFTVKIDDREFHLKGGKQHEQQRQHEPLLSILDGDSVLATSSTGQRISLPASVDGLTLESASGWTFLSSSGLGLKVKWNGQNVVYVETGEKLWGSTLGLCGNLNGDPFDDFLGSDGRTKAENVDQLANEWKAGATCDGMSYYLVTPGHNF